MSLVDHLLHTRTPLELAKLLAATAKENAALRNEVFRQEVELFWMHAADRQADNEPQPKGNAAP